MTARAPIPLIRVSGDHRQVGRAIGEACAPVLVRSASLDEGQVPRQGRSLEELIAESRLYRDATARWAPWVLDELDGAAEGAGVDPDRLFASSVEELWASRAEDGCTDVLVAPEATASGHLLVAHNNDLAARSEPDVVAIEWDVPGEPMVFSLGIGPFISVGFNSAGLSLTGNEVSPNDERPGIPRLLQVRVQLTARGIDEATPLVLDPERASAYNTVLGEPTGRAVNIEASATHHQSWGPLGSPRAIVHTNHYVSEEMLAYEGDKEYAAHSSKRFERARALLDELGERQERVDESALGSVLSDHENGRDSICRHADSGRPDDTQTVFWCIADVTAGRIAFGRGNPCESLGGPGEQVYSFPSGRS